MLDALKHELKQLIADDRCDEVFVRLRENMLRTDCELYDDLVLLEHRYRDAQRARNLNLIDFQEKGHSFANVGHALLWLINRLAESDLHGRLRQQLALHVALPSFHAFTCDRFDQRDQFELTYFDHVGEKLHFYYLYGDARQEHGSLFAALGYRQGNFLENWENGEYDPGIQIKFARLKPEVHRHPLLYQVNVRKALFTRFFPKFNAQASLLQKNLPDLLADGSELHHYGPNDLVFVLLTMDAANWHKDLTPLVLDTFVQQFLRAATLPASAPQFFFFFGVEYGKGQSDRKTEVHTAIIQRQHGGEALDPLEPVAAADITEWFSRYRTFLVPPGLTPDDMRRRWFGEADPLDMLDIQPTLREIIDMHNRGLLLSKLL